MQLQQLLYSQGFGTRRDCAELIRRQQVKLRNFTTSSPWQLASLPEQEVMVDELEWQIEQQSWRYHAKAYLVLHKPAGFECSQKPQRHPSVMTLLPAPLRQRPNAGKSLGVQAVGRLDQDTTGLLLFSDDGAFIHRMTSPKKQIAKVYQITTVEEIEQNQCQQLLDGVVLRDSPFAVAAYSCTKIGSHQLQLAITEGKYHQVKRMVAAVGNKVASLHRSQIGGFALPDDLALGQWRWLSAQEYQLTQQISP